ncbi:MAG: fibronectin type III domain-containing protein [Acidobacteriaceae bacterium]|nr:fibronectin type III domain-containing protein [Acidobacteriaceae bacterium]
MHGGDTLYVRGGIYSNQGLTVEPGVSTPSEPLRIAAYPGETPVLTGEEPYGVVAEIQSPTIIDGLHFENFINVSDAVDIWNSHVTIQNCTFRNVPYQFIRLMYADHVTIQNNFFDGNGELQSYGQGDAIFAGSATDVLVQNNYDTRAGHYFFDAMALPGGGSPSSRIVVRDNTVQSFWGGGIGYGSAQNLLFEYNRVSYVGQGVPYIKASFEIAGPLSITRFNIATYEAGWYDDNVLDVVAEDNGGAQDAVDNRIYGNVFYHNDYLPIFLSERYERNLTDNKWLNNLLYYNQTTAAPGMTDYIQVETYHAYPGCPTDAPDCTNYVWTKFPNWNYFQSNLILHADANGDYPGLAHISYVSDVANAGWKIGDFTDDVAQAQNSYSPFISGNIQENPAFVDEAGGDFRLRPGSPAIAAGGHLAHTTIAGSSRTVPVDDPYFFTNGLGVIPGDVIRIGTNAPVTVTAVSHESSFLTVSTEVTFNRGDNVDLANFNGAAPDIGAFEYSATAPWIYGTEAAIRNATSATISWVTNTAATSQVDYGTTNTYGQTSVPDSTLKENHSIILHGLWPNTTYHYAVISKESDGGRSISQDETFTTPPSRGPMIENVLVSNISSTGVTVTWTTSTASSTQVFWSGTDREYVFNPGYVNSSPLSDLSGVTIHSVSVSGLHPGTLYHFAPQSTDLNGDTSFAPDATFVTEALTAQSPVISNISIHTSAGWLGWFAGTPGQSFAPSGMNCCGYSYGQATFSWTTSTATIRNKVLLIPLVGGGYLQSAELDDGTAVAVSGNPDATTNPSITVYQLAPNTTYVYMLQSTDSDGHTTTSPNYEFTTPSTAPPADGDRDSPKTAGLVSESRSKLEVSNQKLR